MTEDEIPGTIGVPAIMPTNHPINRTWITNAMKKVLSNYTLGLGAICLYAMPQARRLLSQTALGIDRQRAVFNPPNDPSRIWSYTVNFAHIAEQLDDPAKLQKSVDAYLQMNIRMIGKEPYEAIKAYCAETHQMELLRKQPWYHFARIIRNAVSHDFRFRFSKADKKLLPISWNGQTIDLALNDKVVPLSLFGYQTSLELFLAMRDFVTNGLG